MTAVTPTDIRSTRGISKNKPADPLPRFKTALITLPVATTNNDTVAIDLAQNLGINRLMGVVGFHTDTGGIIAQESTESTTAVVNNTLTISVNGTAAAALRSYLVYGL